MKTLKELIGDSIARILVSGIKRKSTILKEVIDNPDNIKIEAFIEGDEIKVTIKKKES